MATARLEDWRDIRELVEMSIGTDLGAWWADPTFGSRLWILRRTRKVNESTVGAVEQALRDCTAWLVSDGLAKQIEVSAEQSGKNRIDYTVTVTKPDGKTEDIKGVWSAV